MKISNLHGYFYVHESVTSEVKRFNSLYNQDLVPKNTYYVFKPLLDFPDYVIEGDTYLGFTFKKSYSGLPHEIFKANGCAYNFLTKIIEDVKTQGVFVEIKRAYGFDYYRGLLLTGSWFENNKKIKGYTCNISLSSLIFAYTGYLYE